MALDRRNTIDKSDPGLLNAEEASNIPLKDLVFRREVGRGSFGVVHEGQYVGTRVAIKTLTTDNPELKKYIHRELQFVKALRHPGIVQFIGVCEEEEDRVHLVMEFVPESLRGFLNKNKSTMGWPLKVHLALETARSLAFLHSKAIIHRDLKTENYLIDDHKNCKVCDFGLARVAEQMRAANNEKGYMTIVGTDEWMAPEVILGEEYNEKADVFSWGVVLIEIVTGLEIGASFTRVPRENFAFPFDKLSSKLPADTPLQMQQVLSACLQDDPDLRPSMLDVIEKLSSLEDSMGPDVVLTAEEDRYRGNHVIIDS